ncbi:16S rRNA (cytosine(1402)-N(4))-methyltransferase RsmH [Gammaproteobacteria bacterium]|nr:16S rRNA (cytosine(1402)-N(4))-methyltransferase RsmH [Gammaproteobacteria bacterium]
MSTESLHHTVLLNEAVEALLAQSDERDEPQIYIDGTFGRGGHSRAILKKLPANARLIAFDRDPEAIAVANALHTEDERLEPKHSAFGEMSAVLSEMGLMGRVDGLLLDLGVSSPQLDDAERGFSFMRDGPLDMRMDTTQGISAAQWINSASETEIADVLYHYGEERHSRRMARRVVAGRAISPILRTGVLAEMIKEANPSWERDKHPATRAFQGIRLFINRELEQLELALDQALEILRPGGLFVVISFHSLEDRIAKRFIAKHARGDDFPRGLPVAQSQLSPKVKPQSKAIKPSRDEIDRNPRARSAVMRVAAKL